MLNYLTLLGFMLLPLQGSREAKPDFVVSINGEEVPHKLFTFFIMPGEQLNISANTAFDLGTQGMGVTRRSDAKYTVKAPQKPGAYTIILLRDPERIILNLLVLTPLDDQKGEFLNGYRIGQYPEKLFNDDPIYAKPKGLFEVTAETENLQLTPNFNMQQFLSAQEGAFPKYLIIRERLLLKLEYLLAVVQSKQIDISTFSFVDGYRTPYYNEITDNALYSRHLWGGAADIFIDQDKNGQMDDLNGDGVIDDKDVMFFYNLVEAEYHKPEYKKFVGGLGLYKKDEQHNGFIHIDVRGKRARW